MVHGYVLPLWPWTSHLIFLGPICKMQGLDSFLKFLLALSPVFLKFCSRCQFYIIIIQILNKLVSSGRVYEITKFWQYNQKTVQQKYPHKFNQQYVDKVSNKWLSHVDVFIETEGFMIVIQNQVIATGNDRKVILKKPRFF